MKRSPVQFVPEECSASAPQRLSARLQDVLDAFRGAANGLLALAKCFREVFAHFSAAPLDELLSFLGGIDDRLAGPHAGPGRHQQTTDCTRRNSKQETKILLGVFHERPPKREAAIA